MIFSHLRGSPAAYYAKGKHFLKSSYRLTGYFHSMTTREAYQLLEPAYFLKDNDLVQPATPEDTETRRRIIDFVHEVEKHLFFCVGG